MEDKQGYLILTRTPGKSIIIDDVVEIVVLDVVSKQVRLGIKAPRNVQVHRYEIWERIKAEVGGNR